MALEEHNNSTSVVWLKRDLRLRDHQALFEAVKSKRRVLLVHIFEPELINDPHYDLRHWRFVSESIVDLNEQLAEFDTGVCIFEDNAVSVFSTLLEKLGRFHLYSYQEIGIGVTFERDLELQRWCETNAIEWLESPYGNVIRGLQNRRQWQKHWQSQTRLNTFDVELSSVDWVPLDLFSEIGGSNDIPRSEWLEPAENFQKGGEKRGWFTLHHFFEQRGKNYAYAISKPEASRKSCSRLSPYLAWGNLSLKQVYHTLQNHRTKRGWGKSLSAFESRLHWHCHFIQKFESECDMEYRPVNRAYEHFSYRSGADSADLVEAWKNGTTGVPLVDANMICLQKTGYINFRMRAMLVSFLTHILNVDWRLGVEHLASLFLDFEPGIHYPQFQMQAAVTGANLIRIYNPIKQAQDHDPEAVFIKKWIPALEVLPTELAIEPWKMTPMEQQLNEVVLGQDYPQPIVDINEAYSEARDRLWAFRKRDDVKQEANRILDKHTVPNERYKYRRG